MAEPTPSVDSSASTAGAFNAVVPVRVVDTRNGTGTAAGPILAGGTATVGLSSRAGVPTGAAVAMTVTVTQPTAVGYLIAYPGGAKRPFATTLTFAAGETSSVTTVVTPAADGTVNFHNGSGGSVQLVVDVTGYFVGGGPDSAPGAFASVPAARVFDTGTGLGTPNAPVPAGGSITVKVSGRAGIPSGAGVVLLGLTVSSPTAAGQVTAYPAGEVRPDIAHISFTPGRASSNTAAVRLGRGGQITIYNNSSGTVRVLGDALGYFTSGSPTAAGAFTKTAPARLITAPQGKVTAGGVRTFTVAGRAGIPTTGATAVMLNLNVLSPTATGSLTAFASGTRRPAVTTTSFTAGRTSAALAIVAVGADGSISLANNAPASVTAQADVIGYFRAGPPPAPPYTWSGPTLADPAAGQFNAISCPATGACVAVDAFGNALRYQTGKWSGPQRVTNTALTSVSCRSVASCVAVTDGGTLMVLTGTTWSSSPTTLGPLVGVSCPTSTFCVALSAAGYAAYYDNGTVTADSTHRITTAAATAVSCATTTFCAVVDASGGWATYDGTTWTGRGTADPAGGLTAVSCPTVTFCAAVDSSGNGLTWNGSAWKAVTVDPNVASQLPSLTAVSCPTATFCTATNPTWAYTWNGATWDAGVQIGDQYYAPQYVSCATPSWCQAASYTRSSVYTGTGWNEYVESNPLHQQPVSLSCPTTTFCALADDRAAVGFNGTTWTAPLALGYVADPTGDDFDLHALSCTSTTFCVAAYSKGDISVANGGAATFNGQKWSYNDDLTFVPYPTDVSCTSTTFCVMVDSEGEYLRFNGTNWTEPAPITDRLDNVSCPTNTFCIATGQATWTRYSGSAWTTPAPLPLTPTDVSCATPTFCVAVDNTGRATRYNGTTWTAPTTIGPDPINAVSCPTTGFCVTVDNTGHASRFNGTTWTAPIALKDAGPLRAVSCTTSGFCVTVDNTGHAYTGH